MHGIVTDFKTYWAKIPLANVATAHAKLGLDDLNAL